MNVRLMRTKETHPPARDHLRRPFASGGYLLNPEISESLNQLADIYHLARARRCLNKIAGVSIDHEGPVPDQQMESERWTIWGSVAAAEDGYLAVLNGLDELTRLSLGMVASLQSPLPFHGVTVIVAPDAVTLPPQLAIPHMPQREAAQRSGGFRLL
jgi:hypothetical protein